MYNLHMATKIKKQLHKQRISYVRQRKYLENYSASVQPQLLDNYNKRINTFLRKMQQHPVLMTEFDQTEFAPHKLFRNFNNQKDKCLGPEKFKFKDHTDWNSIYTEAERSQRKMNQQIMEEKYGDKSLAYRSIASNSEYSSIARHQFRVRSKDKEINPPMKYVCAVPKIMIRKLKSKQNTPKIKTQPQDQDKILKNKQSKLSKDKALQSKNSFNFDEDNRSVRSFKSMRTISDSINNQSTVNMQEDDQAKEKEKKMYLSPKIHFKTLVEAFEKCTDQKSKESMKEVLVKCRVFKVKDQKVAQEVEVDKLAMVVEDAGNTGNSKTLNNGKGMANTK